MIAKIYHNTKEDLIFKTHPVYSYFVSINDQVKEEVQRQIDITNEEIPYEKRRWSGVHLPQNQD
jgi:hypothetical protein